MGLEKEGGSSRPPERQARLEDHIWVKRKKMGREGQALPRFHGAADIKIQKSVSRAQMLDRSVGYVRYKKTSQGKHLRTDLHGPLEALRKKNKKVSSKGLGGSDTANNPVVVTDRSGHLVSDPL